MFYLSVFTNKLSLTLKLVNVSLSLIAPTLDLRLCLTMIARLCSLCSISIVFVPFPLYLRRLLSDEWVGSTYSMDTLDEGRIHVPGGIGIGWRKTSSGYSEVYTI